MTLILTVVVIGQIKSETPNPKAKQGVLDLAGVQWNDRKVVPLDGQWEFYPEELLTPEQLHLHRGAPSLLQVPGDWDDPANGLNPALNGKSYGTYRLLIRNVPQGELLGIAKRYVRFSDALYIDGKRMDHSGTPGPSADAYEPRNEPYTAYFYPERSEVELVLQVANFDFRSGGIYNSIDLGIGRRIEARALLQSSLELLIVGIVLIFSLLFFYLYLRLHRDRIQLLYAFFFIGFALIVVTNGERLLLQWLPGLPFELAYKLKYGAVYGMSVLVSLIAWRLTSTFDSRWKKWTSIPSVLMAAYFALIVLTPFRIYSAIQEPMYTFNLCTYIVALSTVLYVYARPDHPEKKNIHRSQTRLLIICIWLMLINYVLGIIVTWYPSSQALLNTTTLVVLGTFAMLLIDQYVRAYVSMQHLTRQLQLSDKAKDEFLLLTSHELNSPLHSMIHLSRSLLDTPLRQTHEPQIRSKLQSIRNTAYRMSNLVNELIDMSRFKDGLARLTLTNVDLFACLSLTGEVLGFVASSKDVVIVHKLASDARYVMADESRLLQVLYSLVYHMLGQRQNGEFIFTSERKGASVLLRLDSNAARIAGKPPRLRMTSGLAAASGTTAELSVAAQMIRAMNGSFAVGDNAESILIELPVAADAALPVHQETMSPKNTEREEEPPIIPSHSAHIWIATSDLVDMEQLNTLLAEEGFDLHFMDSDVKVQALLSSNKPPDLLIIDAMLPETTGYSLCRQIRTEFSQVELPVLFIQMRSTPADIEACIQAGGNDFITRPLDAGEILVRIHTLIGLKQLVKQAANNEMAFLRSQIKPHFLYNALGTIMSLCFTDGPRAGELLGSFSRYLRILFHLDNSEEWILLRKEIELIQAYAAIEQERFGSRLRVELNIQEGLETCRVMPLLIEPLVENAIRHGVSKKINGGTVKLSIYRKEDRVEVVVSDDGVGMSPEQVNRLLNRGPGEPLTEQGIGLQNVQRRLKHMNGRAPLIQSEPGSGTTVTIDFPYQ